MKESAEIHAIEARPLPYQPVDEQAWITAACSGDLQAFNQLVLRYQGMAYNVACRILGDPEAASDATQDGFLSAYRAMAKFRGGSFKSWIFRIVTNACYDQLRMKRRRPVRSLDGRLVDPNQSYYLQDPGGHPDELLARQELNRAIRAGIVALPLKQRVVLILADVEGLSYDEIAATLGLAQGTVKSRLSRGRAALRDYLWRQEELLPAPYRPSPEHGCSATRQRAGPRRLGR